MESFLKSPVPDKESAGEALGAAPLGADSSSRLLAPLLRVRALASLRYRDYRLLWFGHVFTSMAFWMDQVTRGWLIYELTDSTVQLGLVRGVQAIPILLLSPIAGSAGTRPCSLYRI